MSVVEIIEGVANKLYSQGYLITEMHLPWQWAKDLTATNMSALSDKFAGTPFKTIKLVDSNDVVFKTVPINQSL